MESYDGLFEIISIVIVAVMGLVSNIFIFRATQRSSYRSKIAEQYFKVRGEISDKISKIADLRTFKTYENTDKYIEQVSNLYFKHYDFLPEEVLNQLLCLYTSLRDDSGNIYIVKENKLRVIYCEQEIDDFVDSITLIENTREYFKYQLTKAEESKRKTIAINLQARRVLYAMNECFSLENLVTWEKYLRKAHLKSVSK